MGLTLTEKLIAVHAGREGVEPGEKVSVEVDRFLLGESDFHGVVKLAERLGGADPRAPEKIVVSLDQLVGSWDNNRREKIREIKSFREKWGIRRFYDLGRGGMDGIIFPDGGLVRPGDLVVGGGSQLFSFGALGALALSLEGEELLKALLEGRVTLEVPETVKLVFTGRLGKWVGGKDLAISVWGLLGPQGLAGKAVEIDGEAVMGLDVPDRLVFSSFVANLGARNIMIPADEKTRFFARARSDRPFSILSGDEDAEFADIIEMDGSLLEPQVALPSQEQKVLGVSKLKKKKIDQVIIGTVGNGRIEDLKLAAGLLREYKLHPDLKLIVLPGSQQVLLHAMEEGLIQIFLRTGAHVGLPSERYTDLCHLQGIGEGEHILSTSGMIYPETELPRDAEILYCNPALAAASAVLGHVAEPFEMMRTVKRKATGLMG